MAKMKVQDKTLRVAEAALGECKNVSAKVTEALGTVESERKAVEEHIAQLASTKDEVEKVAGEAIAQLGKAKDEVLEALGAVRKEVEKEETSIKEVHAAAVKAIEEAQAAFGAPIDERLAKINGVIGRLGQVREGVEQTYQRVEAVMSKLEESIENKPPDLKPRPKPQPAPEPPKPVQDPELAATVEQEIFGGGAR